MNTQNSPAVEGPLEGRVKPQRLWIVRVVHEAYLLPERDGQAEVMTLAGCHGDYERGHWYSPAKVRQMLAAERERICAALPGGHSVDPQWVADMVRGL